MIVSFIIRLRHQSILSVSRDCTMYLLFNYQKLYLLVFFLFKNKLDKLFFKEFKNIYKGAFVLGENEFRKSFSPKPRCLAATVNFIFRKMASCWPKFSPLTRKWFYTLIFTSNHFRKKSEKERGKRKPRSEREREKREPRSESTDRRSRRSSIDERCDRPRDRTARSHRSRLSIAPLVGAVRSSDERHDRRSVLFDLGFLFSHSLSDLGSLFSLSLSLSLFPEMNWSENEGEKSFPGQRWKFRSAESYFPENEIYRRYQTPGFGGKWFPEIIFTQNKRTLKLIYYRR